MCLDLNLNTGPLCTYLSQNKYFNGTQGLLIMFALKDLQCRDIISHIPAFIFMETVTSILDYRT